MAATTAAGVQCSGSFWQQPSWQVTISISIQQYSICCCNSFGISILTFTVSPFRCFCMETLVVSQERVPPLDWQGRQRLGNPVWSRLSYYAGLSAPAHHPHKYRPVCPCSPDISVRYTTLTICSAARIAAHPGRHHLSACFIVAGTPAGRFLHSQPWPWLLVCSPMLPDPIYMNLSAPCLGTRSRQGFFLARTIEKSPPLSLDTGGPL